MVNDLEGYPFFRFTLDAKALLQRILYENSIYSHSVLDELLEYRHLGVFDLVLCNQSLQRPDIFYAIKDKTNADQCLEDFIDLGCHVKPHQVVQKSLNGRGITLARLSAVLYKVHDALIVCRGKG